MGHLFMNQHASLTVKRIPADRVSIRTGGFTLTLLFYRVNN